MKYNKLGLTDLLVSEICLGTMTWGEQNSEAEAHQQMDYSIEQGVNFFDTAELYPVPPKPDTQGRTEQYIGSWFANKKNRDKVILATKVVGKSDMEWFRGEKARLSSKHILEAVEKSLIRLKTDYIDLYQLHWPDRNTNCFGKLGYEYVDDSDQISIEETLKACESLVKSGKVRHIGVSNETPWGLSQYLKLSETAGLPRVQSIQNPYNLLNRTFEVGLSEFSHRSQVGLLAYSPLAFGVLSGKYLQKPWPEKGRLTLFSRFSRYNSEIATLTAARYVDLAKEFGVDPAQMALAWVNQQPFLTSNIIGATTMEQLASNIASSDVQLSDELKEKIQQIHLSQSNPCP